MQDTITEKQQDALFKRLCSREENSTCADCKSKGASWVSLGYGVFVCINCSGVHRSFGMHITRVRSTKLDSWIQVDAKIMETVGNQIANLFWEANINSSHKNRDLSRDEERMRFIKDKYQLKAFAKKGVADPITQLMKSNYSLSSADLMKSLTGESANVKKEEKIEKPVKVAVKEALNAPVKHVQQNSKSHPPPKRYIIRP